MVKKSRKILQFSKLVLILSSVYSFQTMASPESWAATGIKASDLQALVNNKDCYRNEKSYIACSEALRAMVENKMMEAELAKVGDIQSLLAKKEVWLHRRGQLMLQWLAEFQSNHKTHFDDEVLSIIGSVEKPSEVAQTLATGMTAFLEANHDPHTTIVPAENAAHSRATGPTTVGLGVFRRLVGGRLIINRVLPGSAAAIAGVRPHDAITHINNQKVLGLTSDQLTEKFRGVAGSQIHLTIERGREPLRLTLTRQAFSDQNVTGEILTLAGRTWGVITINSFSEMSTCYQVSQEIEKMNQSQVAGMIMDLRFNEGGLTKQAACIAGFFVKAKTLLSFEKDFADADVRALYSGSGETMFAKPLVFLMNGGSASASEMLAGIMQDQGRAFIVGQRSFGKGTYYTKAYSGIEGVEKYATQGGYYLPSGKSLQYQGLSPDFLAESVQGENEWDRFFDREDDSLFALKQFPALKEGQPLSGSALADRAALKEKIHDCLKPIAERIQNPADYQKQMALAVLGCQVKVSPGAR